MLVGKKASLSGDPIIARNEDNGSQLIPPKFVVINPLQQMKHYHSVVSGVELELPDDPLKYTATPDYTDEDGIWAGAGINGDNVAMTAAETITTNSRILAIDPLDENGIGETDMVTITLPYIHSAKEGVLRLGSLIEQYGTYESNGISFSDADEIWYLETIGGHNWAAVKIPDDAFVIAPNRFNIDKFDFQSENTLSSKGLLSMINDNHLNPDDEINLRHIFGSSTIKDTRYNNPRAWYIQKSLGKSFIDEPENQDLSFLCYPKHKISIEEIKWALSSHYQNTQFDPYGIGTEEDKKRYRPIGINRNQETHVLQIRQDCPKEIAGVHWLAFGPNTFNTLVPFYSNILDTPSRYRDTKSTADMNNMYWLTRNLALLGDANYSLFSELEAEYEQKSMAEFLRLQKQSDMEVVSQSDTSGYLTKVNFKMSDIAYNHSIELLNEMLNSGSKHMNLRFDMSD